MIYIYHAHCLFLQLSLLSQFFLCFCFCFYVVSLFFLMQIELSLEFLKTTSNCHLLCFSYPPNFHLSAHLFFHPSIFTSAMKSLLKILTSLQGTLFPPLFIFLDFSHRQSKSYTSEVQVNFTLLPSSELTTFLSSSAITSSFFSCALSFS